MLVPNSSMGQLMTLMAWTSLLSSGQTSTREQLFICLSNFMVCSCQLWLVRNTKAPQLHLRKLHHAVTILWRNHVLDIEVKMVVNRYRYTFILSGLMLFLGSSIGLTTKVRNDYHLTCYPLTSNPVCVNLESRRLLVNASDHCNTSLRCTLCEVNIVFKGSQMRYHKRGLSSSGPRQGLQWENSYTHSFMLICFSGCEIRTTCLAKGGSECVDRLVFHGVDTVSPGRDTIRLSEKAKADSLSWWDLRRYWNT